jgi:hypothetical protein
VSPDVRITAEKLHGWRVHRLSSGRITLGIAPDIGGRILSMTYEGAELLFTQPEHRGEVLDLGPAADLRALKRAIGFRLWGGDKTWIAPQSAWWEGIPPVDLDGGRYAARLEERAVRMESPTCRETGLRIVRRIEMRPGGEIVLDQELSNRGDRESARGIWDVTQCLRPMDVYLDAPAAAVRAYPEEGDSVRLRDSLLGTHGAWTVVPCREAVHFKFGARLRHGALVAIRRRESDALALVRQFEIDGSAAYAHDAMVEVYNSPGYDYLEIEVHAPLRPLPPGGRVTHRQTWRIGSIPADAGPEEALAL